MHLAAPLSLLTAFLVSTGCDFVVMGDSMRFTQDFSYAHDLPAGAQLTVENFNGAVEIYSWDTNKIEVAGAKYASREQDLELIRIEVNVTGDRAQVRTVRPSDTSRSRSMGARYRIHVPRKTALQRIATSNGPVRVDGVEGKAG